MTVLVVCLSVAALVAFAVLLAALRSGASDPDFQAGSVDSAPVDDDDEHRAA